MKLAMSQTLWVLKSEMLIKPPHTEVRKLEVGEKVRVVVPNPEKGWLKIETSKNEIGFYPVVCLSEKEVTDLNKDGIPDIKAPGGRFDFGRARQALMGLPWKRRILPYIGGALLSGLVVWFTPWNQLWIAAGQYSALGPNIWIGAGNLLMNLTVALMTAVVLLTHFAPLVRDNFVAQVAVLLTYLLQALGLFWALAATMNENASSGMIIAWYTLAVVAPIGPTYLERKRRVHALWATIPWSLNCVHFGLLTVVGTAGVLLGELSPYSVIYPAVFVFVSLVGLIYKSIRKS